METSAIKSAVLLSEPNCPIRWRRKRIIRKRKMGKEEDGNEEKEKASS